ncbi:transcription factor GTE1-like [Amaranthus tricolor]|uniref:transcription factor GTE1-like n=1 Tax=Amaranthus tricolor TaxID=29722 RepID=UPI002584959F|nr:transcription factor GTE1-like [Amaranthus tricolor]
MQLIIEKMGDNAVDLKDYNDRVDGVISRVNGIEKKLNEIEQFYSNNGKKQANNSKGKSGSKCKNNGKDRNAAHIRKEASASERMQNLIHKFGGIINEITQHKWARPFLEPVDVVNLCLYDYYEVIKTPMDFSTIKKKMVAKNGSGYKHVREVCADVRLIFKNAMVYNDQTNDVHIMARFLLDKFEEKWLKFLPNVTKEEVKREEENAKVAQEATYAEMAREMSSELNAANLMLDKLREQLVQRRWKMSKEEKKQLAVALTQLSVEDLSRALDVVAQSNPTFTPNAEEVDLDVDALSETTLWRLKLLAKDALRAQSKPATTIGSNNNNRKNGRSRNKKNNVDISKIKKETYDARPTPAKKGKMAAS